MGEIARGKTNRQIGDALGLAEKTVKNYVSSILAKLEVARRAEVAACFARHSRDVPRTSAGIGQVRWSNPRAPLTAGSPRSSDARSAGRSESSVGYRAVQE